MDLRSRTVPALSKGAGLCPVAHGREAVRPACGLDAVAESRERWCLHDIAMMSHTALGLGTGHPGAGAGPVPPTAPLVSLSLSPPVLSFRPGDAHLWALSPLLSDDHTLHGPVFVQEPSHVMFPLGAEEEKLKLSCQVRGNPKPHIRCVDPSACLPARSFCR